ncbi:MAG TPA: zinc-binding dehydrogenase [Xanthobacteraceae bacterium]|jgi:threonine dehydrogenase-like Zn-dependent dehydrogenase|nr:zinc-binding dehydrogenase [Xanthobacteraceae bacterium]
MRGVTFLGDRKLELAEFPDPTPGPGEIVIAIKASGMCGSDLKPYRATGGAAALGLGKVSGPVIAGHEPCGIVTAVGPGVGEREARVGNRVMVHHYSGCGVCRHCLSGWTQMCAEGSVVYGVTGHGAHAPYMKVPAYTLVPLPGALSFATGAAISCGTGTAYGALRRMNLAGTHSIAIVGQGPVGLSATQLAVAMGARVIALDVSAERLERAKEFGADALIDPNAGDPIAAIKDLTHGVGTDLSLDTSGVAEGRVTAVRATRPWGTACFVGEGGNVTIEVSPDMLRKQLTIIGSWTFSTIIQAECASFVADRKIDVEHLFTHRWQLPQADEAYRLFDRQTSGKGVFLM